MPLVILLEDLSVVEKLFSKSLLDLLESSAWNLLLLSCHCLLFVKLWFQQQVRLLTFPMWFLQSIKPRFYLIHRLFGSPNLLLAFIAQLSFAALQGVGVASCFLLKLCSIVYSCDVDLLLQQSQFLIQIHPLLKGRIIRFLKSYLRIAFYCLDFLLELVIHRIHSRLQFIDNALIVFFLFF